MNEYLSQLYDWISRTDNTFSSRRSRDEFISKMMNEDDYNTQIYNWVNSKDTSFSSKYTTDQFKAKTLANYTPLKKKDKSELTSQEVATESITKEATPPTLSGASKSEFDYESFIDKDEEFALPELENELAGKGYSIEKTGLGDALLVTDNITKEQIEIDLQPISWFGKDKYRKEEIAKVKKLIETPSDVRRKALSANQLEVYSEDRAAYINNLKRLYPDIGFDYVQDPSRGGFLKVTKGSSVGEFPIAMGTGNDAKQFADINNFLYQNITDDEASSIIKRQNADEYKRIVEEYNKIDDKIDISMESAEADFYGKDYFKGLFKALEQSGVSVPPEAKQELEKGTITRQEYRGNTPITLEVNMGKSQIDSGVQKYFGSNPEVLAKINQYNLSGTVSVRKSKIDRAKKLAIEDFLEDSPDRESTKEILRRVNKDASEEQLRIETNLEMAKSHLEKLVSSVEQSAEQISKKYPKLKVTVIQDEKGNLVDIVSSEPVKEINDLKSEIKDASGVYMSLAYKSKYDYDKVASKAETTGQYIELANKSYDLFDTAMADINNALSQMAGSFEVITTLAEGAIEDVTEIPSAGTVTSGMSAEKRLKLAREGMAESNQKLDQAYKTQRTYQEAIKEGSKFEFATRQFATQAPNIALALATSGAGSALGMSNAGISTLVATQFGVSSAGQKYDELTTRQEISSIAEKAKKDLETVKGIIPDDEYFAQMYELERAIEDGKITPWQKTLAVTGTGLVEGLVTRYIGTVPNSIKVLKDLKVKPGQFMDDILRSNYKATLGAFKEFGKRTGGEIIEETAIDALTQVNDYAFLGDQIDLSSLDDVAVTSIITSGAMNTPSMAYSTILTQTNVNRYKNKIKSLTGEITTLRDMLSDPDLTNIQRASIHDNINKIISQVADQTTNMEGDALLLGADNIKELMTLSGVRNSMLKKAGVENDDSYDIANAKTDTYLKGVDQKESKKFVDQMKYIDGRRNDILKSINYEGAVERVFGEKGKEIAKDLDPSLTPQQKYVEVYGQVRQEINDNALTEFKDAIEINNFFRSEEEVRVTTEQEAEVETKKFQDDDVILKEETFTVTDEDGGRVVTTVRTNLDGSLRKAEVENFDADGNSLGKGRDISLADNDVVIRDGLTAEQLLTDRLVEGEVIEKTERSGTEINNPKKIAGLTTDQKQKLGIKEEVRVTTEQEAEVDERAYKPEEVKETTDTAAFAASQQEAIAQRVEDKLQVTPVTQEDAQAIVDEGGKLFMTEDGKAGAYVKKDGYMGGLFKQPGADRTQAAKVLQDARIEAGGKFFDAFGINVESGKGTNLEDIYIKNGFRPIARMTFNPEFAPKGWEKTNLKNRPDNVFFVYDPTYKATKGEGQRIEDYDQAYDLAKNFSPEAAKIEAEVQQLRELFKAPDQRKQVENAEKALKGVAPDVKIVVHESEQAYAEATNEQNRAQKTAGEYNPNTKTIHINPEKANVRTVAHEVFHAILLNMVKTDAEAQRLTGAMMKAVAKVASPELKAYLDEFASNYDENIRAEEKLAELVGKLASEYSSLPKPTQNIIKRWLDRLAKMFGLKPFTDEQVIDVLNTIAGKVARGEAITESDVSAISEGASTFFSDPTTINKKQVTGEVKVSDTPADLSFVTSKDIIDIDGLVNEISSKGQKVWFWVADQLGRGIYNDTQVGTEHFLDAGPSFALDPKNRSKKAIWATGKGEAEVSKLINKSDYIFIMSGSPIKSKLFNKRVLNILKNRVGEYNAFKEGALNAKPTKPFRDVLEGHDSWESLTESPDRKKLLNAIESIKEKKDTPLKTFLQDNNAFIELNDLRDGFYAQNDFQMNDVMLVLKPTAFGGKSDHSTYENDILGEVVGIPNKKVNAYDLMPDEVKQKYSDAMTESQKAQVVAPYGIGVKGISPRKQFVGVKANLTADQKSSKKKAEDMIKKGMDPLQIKQQTGFEVGVDGKLRLELDASKSKEIGPGLRHSFGETKVSEVLEFTDLLKAYPFISDIPIFFNDGFPSAGHYDGVRIRMNSALINEKGNGDHLGTLLHEIQHVIQIQEGFTGGANPATIRDEVKKAVRNLNNKAINAIQTQVEKLTGIRPELTITEGDRKELTEVYENNEAALIDMLSRHTVEDVDAVVKVIRNADNSYYAVENLMEEFGMPNDEAVLLNGIHGVFDMKLYEALSGEVEARNVQNRRTMTEAERRNSLAAETETISQLMSVEDGGKFINVPIKRSEQIRRKQVANYDNVIKVAKENNISDAAIRQYLSENGMTLNEADAVVKNYNDRIRKIRQKKEGLFTKDNIVLENLDSIRRYVSSGKGKRPKSMQVGQEYKQGFIDSQSKAAMFEFRRLKNAIKGYKGDVNALKSNLEAYMRGDKSVSLPENIQKIAFKMRTHIDGLSKMLVETGAVSDVAFDDLTTVQKKDLIKQFKTEEEARKNYTTSKENILKKIGSYMTRSYEVFNNKNWKEQVTDEVLQNAKNYLRDSMRDQAVNEASKTNRPVDVVLEEMVDDQVNKLLDRESAKEYVSNANVSSKNIGVLKRRVDIPAPLRALMGEYTDTAKNYVVTVNKIATLAAQQNFLNEMKLAGMDVFFFEKPTGNFKAQVAAEGSKTMDPLNGLYTTPEILKVLKGGDVYGFNLGPIQPLFDGYLKAVGVVKYNKTILSPGTHAKNFLGNMYFMLANGHIDPKDWHKAAKAIAADFGIITSEEAEAKMLEYVRAGVISQSVNLRDLKAMFSGDISSEQQFEDKMTKRFNNPTWSKIKEKPEQWYQAEDDFFKIIAYESNKARYSKAFYNKPFDQLNDTQKKEVLDRAIEVTKNTLPNYSRLPEIRKLMRAIPAAGTFISFHIEAIRTAYNTIDIAATEIKDPRTREIGIKRLSGILALIGLKAFVLSSIGIGDDDDEVKESTRRFLPTWSTNSALIIESVKDGKVKYRDLSSSDPWGVIDRAMNGFMSGEDTLDGFIEATKEVVGPFFDEDILLGAINRANEKTNKALPLSENLEIWLKELYGALEPGAVTSAIKISKSEDKKNEIVGQLSGYKSRETDVVKSSGFKFRDVRSYPDGTIFAVTKKYSTAWRKFKEGEATAQEVQDAYNESNQSYKQIMSDVLKDYTAAIKLGTDMSEINQKMKDAGFSIYEINHISSGVIPELSRNREAVKIRSVF